MLRCLLLSRLPDPQDIRLAVPQSVLNSWRSVWKDRNEDTAYLTAWKRLQDKLQASLLLEPTSTLFDNSSTSASTSSPFFDNNPVAATSSPYFKFNSPAPTPTAAASSFFNHNSTVSTSASETASSYFGKNNLLTTGFVKNDFPMTTGSEDALSHLLKDNSVGAMALFFKNNPAQRISHVEQWQDIVFANHADPDLLQHLGLKETIDRIKQSWTVGAKLYGIPESFIRVCVASCPVCSSTGGCGGGGGGGSSNSKSKRRRFEYTESIDVPAREVQRRLHQLAVKHKVVLCIRQKYIRYKPVMAEVKDYACHRAGEPTGSSNPSKRARVLKREPYQSKRCGCGFRIRAIVPIINYNEKDKTFVYDEEGTAVFKLYAVHSGHEPGPLDGNARIIHRMVGNKLSYDLNPEMYGVMEDSEPELYIGLIGKDDGGDSHQMVLQQLRELKIEAKLLEGKISKMPTDMLDSLSNELSDVIYRLRNFGGGFQNSEEVARSVEDDEISRWQNDANHHLDGHERIYGKDAEIIEDDDTDFGSSLGPIVQWDGLTTDCQDRNMLLRQGLKPEKWMMKEDCGGFDEKSILHCGEDEEEAKLIKPLSDPNLVGMQVDGFYSDSAKWYDSPGGLDASIDSGDGSFRHGGIV